MIDYVNQTHWFSVMENSTVSDFGACAHFTHICGLLQLRSRLPLRRGGFFLACEDFGEKVGPFILRLRLVRAHSFHSMGQDQSTVAQRVETTVAECSLTSYVLARFRIGSHIMPKQRHSQSTPTSLGQGCMRV